MANIFLSYAAEDFALARAVHGWLVDDGHKAFEYLDPRDGVTLGEQWEQQLYERLRWADAMVCVVTSAYVASTWCTAEVGIARSQGTPLLPIFAEPGVTHPVLASTHHADYARDPEAARATVIEALRRVKGPWWSRSRWPEWLRRALRPRRRTTAGLIGGVAAVSLGVSGLILVLDSDAVDTVDTATQRLRDADPCPLLNTTALTQFGAATRTVPPYLESCIATITSAGHETSLRVGFKSAIPLSTLMEAQETPVQKVGGIYVETGKQIRVSYWHECTYRLWLAEDQPVIAINALSTDEKPINLCAVSETAVRSAITTLDRDGGITYRKDRTANYSHARADACDLLDSIALGHVPGLDPASAEPGYAHWSCFWSGNDDRTKVTLEFVLEEPDFTGYDRAVRSDADGKPAYVSSDSDGCSADVVHRSSPGPGRATDMLRLGVEAPQSTPAQLCVLVTDLATAAEQRLSD